MRQNVLVRHQGRSPGGGSSSNRERFATFGARHRLVTEWLPDSKKPGKLKEHFQEDLDIYFGLVAARWRKIVGEEPHYDLFTNPYIAGLSVIERRSTTKHAEKHHIRWNANDYGRVVNELNDRIGEARERLGIDDYQPIPIKFTGVKPIGHQKKGQERRKLAAVADPGSPGAQLLVAENEIILDVLPQSLRGYKHPFEDPFETHLTIGMLYRRMDSKKREACIDAAKTLMPVTTEIFPISFQPEEWGA